MTRVKTLSWPDRCRIISVARSLFNSNGYDQTSLEQICEQTGINKQEIHQYFLSKDDILEAVWSES